MKRYRGTEQGPMGTYLNLSTGELVQLYEETHVLPGSSQVGYIKVPSVLAGIIGPLAGLALIVFLPFIGVAGAIAFLGYKLWRGVLALERKTVPLFALSWNPGKAHFARQGGTRKERPESKDERELKELESEVTTRKKQGER